MQLFSNDNSVRNDTVRDIKDFNCKSLATQDKKGEQLVSLMSAIKKVFDLMGDEIVELTTQEETLKNEFGV